MKRGGRRSSALVVVVAALVAAVVVPVGLALASPASAQTGDPSTTTSTTSTTDTTLPVTTDTLPTTTTSTTSTTTTTLPPGVPPQDPGLENNDPTGTAPDVNVTVPPRDPSDAGGPAQAVFVDVSGAQAKAKLFQSQYDAAIAKTQALQARVGQLTDQLNRLTAQSQQAVKDLLAARKFLAERAANAYMRGGESIEVLAGDPIADPVGYGSRLVLLNAVLDRDTAAVENFKAAQARVTADQAQTAHDLVDAQSQLDEAQLDQGLASIGISYAKTELAVTFAGGTLVIHGFVFPVANPHYLFNDYGDPRLPGTPQAHVHQGDDIAAAEGTPEFACERGVITSIGTSDLGGNQVWLKGESGTSYYYAHLSAFADTLRLGGVVEAGDIIGLVGQTGDASGPHLHFEIHPNGGPAIDPYPVLAASDTMPKP